MRKLTLPILFAFVFGFNGFATAAVKQLSSVSKVSQTAKSTAGVVKAKTSVKKPDLNPEVQEMMKENEEKKQTKTPPAMLDCLKKKRAECRKLLQMPVDFINPETHEPYPEASAEYRYEKMRECSRAANKDCGL